MRHRSRGRVARGRPIGRSFVVARRALIHFPARVNPLAQPISSEVALEGGYVGRMEQVDAGEPIRMQDFVPEHHAAALKNSYLHHALRDCVRVAEEEVGVIADDSPSSEQAELSRSRLALQVRFEIEQNSIHMNLVATPLDVFEHRLPPDDLAAVRVEQHSPA